MTYTLVISDIHGNYPALQHVLDKAESYDEILVLGDLVDYGPMPGEVIDALKGIGARVIRGNHDHAVAYGVDCRCGEATHWLSVWFRENITFKLLSRNDRKYLGSLPYHETINVEWAIIEAVHGAPRNMLYAYLHPWLSDDEVCSLISKPVRLKGGGKRCGPGKIFLVGHTHYQFARYVRGSLVLNPGSVGQPRDGDPRAGYALIDMNSGEIRLGRVKYPVDRVINKLEKLGVPNPYMDALKHMLINGRVPQQGWKKHYHHK